MIGEKQEPHEYLYWEFLEKGGRQGIRKDNWKAVKYDMSDNPEAPVQLFDLAVDIREKNDVSTIHPDIVDDMNKLMRTAHTPSDVFRFDYEKEK